LSEAYARIAGSYGALGSWIGQLGTEAAADSVDLYVGQALRLNWRSAVGHSNDAYSNFFFKRNFSKAEEKFLLANQFDPSNIINITGYQHFLNCMGRFDESLEWWETGNKVDPLSIWNYAYKGTAYFLLGRKKEALDFYQRAFEYIPYHPSTVSERIHRHIHVLEEGQI